MAVSAPPHAAPRLAVLACSCRALGVSGARWGTCDCCALLLSVGLPPQPPGRDLSECQLASLPPEIGALTRLQRLDLHSNKIPTLPPTISALARLDRLSLHRCV